MNNSTEKKENTDSYISFNFLLVKGRLTDPKTLRLLLILVFMLIGKVSFENIPLMKSIIQLISNL